MRQICGQLRQTVKASAMSWRKGRGIQILVRAADLLILTESLATHLQGAEKLGVFIDYETTRHRSGEEELFW
jgi:hypothetical protein